MFMSKHVLSQMIVNSILNLLLREATLYTQVLSDKLIQFKLCIKSIQSILKGYISWNGLALVCTPCS